MANLYVTDQGAVVRKDHGVIRVEKESERIVERPIKDIQTLVLFGSIQVSTQAMLALLEQGCDVALMTQNGHFRGRVSSAMGKNCLLRIRQYEYFSDPVRRLSLAKAYVLGKIANSKVLLKSYHYSVSNPFRDNDLDDLDQHFARAGASGNLDELRGHEGAAAAFYWRRFGQCLNCGLVFEKRVYHPSPDPVNALLSFGYSFVARELQSVLDAIGLDPYIGFFHEADYGRASLSLDLMEEFRAPVVDRLILRLFNKRCLDMENFEIKENGQCYLKKEAMKLFVSYYEQWVDDRNAVHRENRDPVSWRKAFWKQGELLRSAILENGRYQPYTYNPAAGAPGTPEKEAE